MVSFQGELSSEGKENELHLFSYSLRSICYQAAVTMSLISWYFAHWWPCLPYVNGECSSVCDISSLSQRGIESSILCVKECPAGHVFRSDVAPAGTAAREDGKADASERY
jgi:hypothetical protein